MNIQEFRAFLSEYGDFDPGLRAWASRQPRFAVMQAGQCIGGTLYAWWKQVQRWPLPFLADWLDEVKGGHEPQPQPTDYPRLPSILVEYLHRAELAERKEHQLPPGVEWRHEQERARQEWQPMAPEYRERLKEISQ